MDDDPLGVKLVVDPVEQDPDELLQLRVLVGLRLDHRTLLVLVKLIFLLSDEEEFEIKD